MRTSGAAVVRASQWLALVENALAGLVLAAVLFVVAYELVARGVFGHSNLWTDELARLLLILMTYAAAVGLTRDGANVHVELFVGMVSPRGQARIQWFCDLLCFVFAATAAWLGARYVIESASFGISFAHSDLPFPVWVAQTTIPVCFTLMTLRLLLRLVGVRPEQPVSSVEA